MSCSRRRAKGDYARVVEEISVSAVVSSKEKQVREERVEGVKERIGKRNSEEIKSKKVEKKSWISLPTRNLGNVVDDSCKGDGHVVLVALSKH